MIGAVVLAAGESRRMGRPKMLLPWGDTTVIGQVIGTLVAAGVADVVVVTGAVRNEIEATLQGLPVRVVFNPEFANGEMTRSLQVGIDFLRADCKATLVVLGDQPQMEMETVAKVIRIYRQKAPALVVPSFEQRRGHPWLVDCSLWEELLALRAPQTLRGFMHAHQQQIHYLLVDSETVLSDLDTPEDYARFSPG